MCGRLNVIADPMSHWVSDLLNIDFRTTTNNDLRPTDAVDVIARSVDSVSPVKTSWGIRPSWSKKIIINAQGETAAVKRTFRTAFTYHRCLVPCTGWYEWKTDQSGTKQKFSFSGSMNTPFLMGGIFFEGENGFELVTLTTKPNAKCAEIHKRMPVLISPDKVSLWLYGDVQDVMPMVEPIDGDLIKISGV